MCLTICRLCHHKKTTTVLITASQIVSMVLLPEGGQKNWTNMAKRYIPVTILMKRYLLFFITFPDRNLAVKNSNRCDFISVVVENVLISASFLFYFSQLCLFLADFHSLRDLSY